MIRHPPAPTLFPYTTLFRSTSSSPTAAATRASPSSRRAACSSSHGASAATRPASSRSEEHTSELQSRVDLVCRLLLEKKNARHEANRPIDGDEFVTMKHAPP